MEVHIHDDHFPPTARDEDWLGEIGRREWIVFTKDDRIRYRAAEFTAVKRASARVFVLTGKDLQGREMGEIFVKALPAIKRLVTRIPPPFIAKVTRSASVLLLTGT